MTDSISGCCTLMTDQLEVLDLVETYSKTVFFLATQGRPIDPQRPLAFQVHVYNPIGKVIIRHFISCHSSFVCFLPSFYLYKVSRVIHKSTEAKEYVNCIVSENRALKTYQVLKSCVTLNFYNSINSYCKTFNRFSLG